MLDLPAAVIDLIGRHSSSRAISRLAVLWDGRSHRAWLDQGDDGDFRNDRPTSDFSVKPGFGILGTDNPATEVRESLGYAVSLQPPYLSLTFGMSSHASGVAGFAAA